MHATRTISVDDLMRLADKIKQARAKHNVFHLYLSSEISPARQLNESDWFHGELPSVDQSGPHVDGRVEHFRGIDPRGPSSRSAR